MENTLYLQGKKLMQKITVGGVIYAVMPMLLELIQIAVWKILGTDIGIGLPLMGRVALYWILEIAFTVACLVLLNRGYVWARYLFVAGGVIRLFQILAGLIYEKRLISPITINFVIIFLYFVPVAVVFFRSSALKEFWNLQKTSDIEEKYTYENHQKNQEKRYLKGKIMMTVILVCELLKTMILLLPDVMLAISQFKMEQNIDFSISVLGAVLWKCLWNVGINLIWLILIYKGFIWAKYIYSAGLVLSAILLVVGLPNAEVFSGMLVAFLLLWILYDVVVVFLLFGNHAIEEFLYRQKTDKRYYKRTE